MAIPPHTSFATAISLATGNWQGAQATYDVHDNGTTYDVFYSIVAPTNVRVISAFAFGGIPGSGYQPQVDIYSSDEVLLFQGADNLPIQFPVTAGELYYLKIVKNGNIDPSVFVLTVEVHEREILDQPTIFVPDDTPSFPAAVIATYGDGTVVEFVPDWPAGEAGDILHDDGVILMEDSDAGDLKFFSVSESVFTQLATIAFTGEPRIRTNRGLDVFYVGSDTSPVVVRTVTAEGAFGPKIHTLTAINRLGGLAASNDGTVIYHSRVASGTAISRWDAVNDVALSDLYAGETGYFIGDILVMDDGSIVAMTYGFGGSDHVKALRFGISGTLLNTYDFGLSSDFEFPGGGTAPRMAYDPNGLYFWVWTHPSPGGLSRFQQIRLSDGVVMLTREVVEYETGILNDDQTANPSERFGISFSCPFFILPQQIFPVDESIPCPCPPENCDCPPSTPGNDSPSAQPIPTSPGAVLPPAIPIGPVDILSDAYWTAQCVGGGEVPLAADPTDAESWVA